ncbi:MAG: hypothetical protein IJY08_04405 [Clostridia bacterium]|nr:hypothetical protein [Clostridia bacterium]
MKGNKVILAAHRGDRLYHPENTVPAFVASLEIGVDMIETDIHMTSDGELIIMHDRSAMRTAGVDRNVDEMTAEEIKKLDVGYLFSEQFRGTRVPTVKEFLDLIKDTDLLVNWELKDYPHIVGAAHAFSAADRLIDLIEQYEMQDRSMVNSFSLKVLEHIYKKRGHRFPIHGQGIYKCPRTKDTCETPLEELFDWCCLYPEEQGCSPVDYEENFDYCVKNGIIPCVCIPDTLEAYRKAIDYGCKMFTSNNIYEADRILRKLGVR